MAEKDQAAVGRVLAVSGNRLTVFGNGEQKQVSVFGNPQYPLIPKAGDTVLLLPVEGSFVCIGVLLS